MSLADILANHSRDISARIQHQNDADEAVAQRKATTLEEHFQNAKDAIENVGTELASAGTAFHMGRKIYTKYKGRQARLANEKKTETSDSASDETSDARFQARPDEAEGEAPTGATDEPAPVETTPQPVAQPPSQELGTIQESIDPTIESPFPKQEAIDRITQMGKERQAAQDSIEAEHPDSVTEPTATETQPAQDLGDAGTIEGQQNRAAAVEQGQAEAPTGAEESNPFEEFNTREFTPLQSGGSEPVDHPVNEANVETPAEANTAPPSGGSGAASAEDVEEGARAFMNPATGEARAAANIASRQADNSSIIDKGINGAKKVVSNLTNTAEGDASTVAEGILPEVGEALDFLGPLGAIGGVVTSLIGLFEGLGHKQEDASDVPTNLGDMPVTQTGAGIDTKAIMESAPKAGATAY